MELPILLVLGGSACGQICNNGCYQRYNIIYAGLEEHCFRTPEGEPCKSYGYRCDKLEGSYSNYLDVQGDWYTKEFWGNIKHLLKMRYDADAFDIIQFPQETAKYLPGGLEVNKLYDTPVAADLIAANIYELLKPNGLLYIDYAIKYNDVPTDWTVNTPFSGIQKMYTSLEHVGFGPASSVSDELEKYSDKPKLLNKLKVLVKGYPVVHRSETPLGSPDKEDSIRFIPDISVRQFVIVLEKGS